MGRIDLGKVTSGAMGLADEYSSALTYQVGDYCVYGSKSYKCKTAIFTPEAWDASKWQEAMALNEVYALKNNINTQNIANDERMSAIEDAITELDTALSDVNTALANINTALTDINAEIDELKNAGSGGGA